MSSRPWFRDREAWRLIARGYLTWLSALMLVWEIAQARLYALWREAEGGYIAFSILHCTLGDVLIGGISLALSLTLLRQGAVGSWRWQPIAAVTVALGMAYTIFSEWMNLTVLRSWAYAESMPTISFGDARIGLTPLLQWLVVPLVALYFARLALLGRGA
ncbi:MAG TPA: hypothetical protein VFR66_01435 [Burkholderiales bacterium]|nr:hypothetical protein [Burkholderiales bacterium]